MSTRRNFYEGDSELFVVTVDLESGERSVQSCQWIGDEEVDDAEEPEEDLEVVSTPPVAPVAVPAKAIGCDTCGSKGKRHKNTCILRWHPKAPDGLDEEQARFNSFKPSITEKQYKSIRLEKVEETSMADVADEYNVSEAIVELAWEASTYDGFLRAERKAQQ